MNETLIANLKAAVEAFKNNDAAMPDFREAYNDLEEVDPENEALAEADEAISEFFQA